MLLTRQVSLDARHQSTGCRLNGYEAAKIDVEIAKSQLTQRTSLKPDDGVGVPGPQLKAALAGVIPVLVDEAIVKPGTDPIKALNELVDPTNAAVAVQVASK